MEALNQGKKRMNKFVLILCNIALVAIAVFFTVWYSNNVKSSQEQLRLENFCTTVDTMRQISERNLSRELSDAASWASYIEQAQMTMEEAMDYIRAANSQEDCEAHFVDMDTFEAWSTRVTNGSNTIEVYRGYYENGTEYIAKLRRIYDGEKYVFGRYTIKESQRNVISVGQRVLLREADGSSKYYLLLRVIPVEHMKQLWLFPVNYPSAEIGLIATNADYVIPSYSMRSGNFWDFVQYYNFPEDYNATESELAQLKEQSSGLMELYNSKHQLCYWYYSQLEEFDGLDIMGYIPVADLTSDVTNNLSIVYVVAGILMLMALLDGAYIMSINRQLRTAVSVAEHASKAKTQFLSTMSHDIRTPLNAVLGMTELAQSHVNDADYVQECLRKITLSGNHLLTLINDILEISRVESGRISVNPAPFDIRELTSELESITRSQAVGHGLELEVQCDNLPYSCLRGDKLRLTQVYLNLLNNAVKYTGPGGIVRLEMQEERLDDDNVILTCIVEDTGTGMSSEFQKTMYDSFTRAEDGRIDKIQGTGLGLAIVKRMVMLMNGSIECVSAQGVGTTFTVKIPLTIAPVSALNHPDSTLGEDPHHDLKGKYILIAEDNDINWEIISEMLSDHGLQCDRAENGRSCVDRLMNSLPDTYDLVLMDVQMPVMNGRDATRELRASKREDLRRIPIVAMTADAFAEDVQMCIDAGMDAHIAKPIELDKVLATIRLQIYRKYNADGRQG